MFKGSKRSCESKQDELDNSSSDSDENYRDGTDVDKCIEKCSDQPSKKKSKKVNSKDMIYSHDFLVKPVNLGKYKNRHVYVMKVLFITNFTGVDSLPSLRYFTNAIYL